MIHFFVTISFIPALVLSDLPISDPYTDPVRVDKNLAYNLIDTNPTCFWKGVCPFKPGGEMSTFPNSEERFQHMLHNMHRMFPNNSLATPLGSRFYGTNGDDTWWRNGEYCGSTDNARLPMYWYSNANQLARFKQWDEKTCEQWWYSATVVDASGDNKTNNNHVTCKYGTTSPVVSFTASGGSSANFSVPSGVDRCSLFGDDCGYGARGSAYCDESIKDIDRCWFESEGICGGNSCLDSSAHCDPIFASKYNYVGKGFVAGMNGACAVYNRFAKQIWYLLPIAAHFDERVKVHRDDLRSDGKHFGLMLEYFDANDTQTPRQCYALYAGAIHELPVFISNNHPHEVEATNYRQGQDPAERPELSGTWNPDPDFYSIDDYNVLFLQYFDPPEATCEPYAFICKTSLGNVFRLPEDGDYYFGTEWMDWSYTDYLSNQNYDCKENHYYSHETEGWTVNGGPDLTQSDIWYYEEGNECIGCDKIEILDCLSQCIYDSASDSAPSQTCQDACVATPAPIGYHSAAPTLSSLNPTQDPTSIPTNGPTVPTVIPTQIPTPDPTIHPTDDPTSHPTRDPIIDPTHDPTSDPTLAPTHTPTHAPSSYPTVNPTMTPTNILTDIPTVYPTDHPSIHPTINPTMDPTADPTLDPTVDPTGDPILDPTIDPTADPTKDPTALPTAAPTIPSLNPTQDPTSIPTNDPTVIPTQIPTLDPSPPTKDPTDYLTSHPTRDPIIDPTHIPTHDPSSYPTVNPTMTPTDIPTVQPTDQPSTHPTIHPTMDPTADPTIHPTHDPTSNPGADPTINRTHDPTRDPTIDPTTDPTHVPTADPSVYPTINPSWAPTNDPTSDPIMNPTTEPTSNPTAFVTTNTLNTDIINRIKNPMATNNSEVTAIAIVISILAGFCCASFILIWMIYSKYKRTKELEAAANKPKQYAKPMELKRIQKSKSKTYSKASPDTTVMSFRYNSPMFSGSSGLSPDYSSGLQGIKVEEQGSSLSDVANSDTVDGVDTRLFNATRNGHLMQLMMQSPSSGPSGPSGQRTTGYYPSNLPFMGSYNSSMPTHSMSRSVPISPPLGHVPFVPGQTMSSCVVYVPVVPSPSDLAPNSAVNIQQVLDKDLRVDTHIFSEDLDDGELSNDSNTSQLTSCSTSKSIPDVDTETNVNTEDWMMEKLNIMSPKEYDDIMSPGKAGKGNHINEHQFVE